MVDMSHFKGKKALVTGGSRGLGRAISLELARHGADVAINYLRNSEAAERTAGEIRALGAGCEVIQADMADHKSVKELFAALGERFGRLDLLVSNAVSGVLGPAERIGRLGWEKAVNTNARAFMLLMQQAVKLFPESGGRVVAISSIGSHTCLSGYTAVGASKAALEALVRYFGKEMASRGIGVNAVAGGPINTSALDYFPDKEELLAEWTSRAPQGRIAEPEDIVPVVSFLLSEDAHWIQGQTIVVDGGLTL
jgi:NAD(P)-dependent dehydrogenase (short-subunit alcohol dehydrogenase family)